MRYTNRKTNTYNNREQFIIKTIIKDSKLAKIIFVFEITDEITKKLKKHNIYS